MFIVPLTAQMPSKCVLYCVHTAVSDDVCVLQDYGLNVNTFKEIVSDCPQRLLDLAASCCMVGG